MLIIFLVLSMFLQAANHSATVAWVDNNNPAGTTYTVYRAAGLCSGNPSFTKIATAVATKGYVDTTVQPGNYAYTISATFNGAESAQSVCVGGLVPAFPVSNVTVVIQ